jgi:two-component system, cell cycle sensor histidine kinase and response regulator CckA
MATPLRVLFVEDNEDDVALVLRALRSGGYDVVFHRRVEASDTLAAALKEPWDVVVSDFRMPAFDGPAALAVCQRLGVETPFIIVSGTVGEAEAVTSMKAGAADFISKHNLARLCPAIERELRDHRERQERKRVEAQLRQAQKMEAVGHLAGGVAHDFNNILGVIMGHGELLLRQMAAEDPRRARVERMYEAADRAAALTRQLLTFSRQQVGQPTVVRLNHTLGEALRMLERLIGEHVQVATALDPDLWAIKADPGQIEQVVMNLAINARDAMPNGGTLRFETRNVYIEDEMFDLPPGPYVLLAVEDTGHGMDAATLSHVFEPFFTTKEIGKGTGPGLATVYGIVTQAGGHVDVESEPDRGTTFRIYLPRTEAKATTTAPPRPLDAPRGSEVILLLEDEVNLRLLIREVLEEAGYLVIDADTPESALERGLAHEGTLHLLLTDVVMPRVSGFEAARRLAAARPAVKVLYMSGHTDRSVPADQLSGRLLNKPFRPEALLIAVRETLDGRGAPP